MKGEPTNAVSSSDEVLLIYAGVTLFSLEETGWTQFLGLGARQRPSLLKNGLHHCTEVITCNPKVIAPGASGRATLVTASRDLRRNGASVGDTLPLMGGATEIGQVKLIRLEDARLKGKLRDSFSIEISAKT